MAQPNKKVSSTFTINKILNLTNNNDHDISVKQVPFFLNNVGAPTIKGKITTPAYTVTT